MRYYLHHCFARMPYKAAERLRMRLVNQRVLIAIDEERDWKAVVDGNDEAMAFKHDSVPGNLPERRARMERS